MSGFALALISALGMIGTLFGGQTDGRPERPEPLVWHLINYKPANVSRATQDLCRPLSSLALPHGVIAEREQREGVLVQVRRSHITRMGDSPVATALQGAIPCLKVTQVPGDDQVAAVEMMLDNVWLGGGHLVYRDGTAWRIKPLRVERWPR